MCHLVEFSAKRGRPSAEHPFSRLSERHFVGHIPPPKKQINPTRQCIICCSKRDIKGKNLNRETKFYRSDCDVGLGAEYRVFEFIMHDQILINTFLVS
ncbi:hypothetical protein TNCV_1619411 [Trichonephila clavipes]|nr:hypothetical protein TNCV_1619411 [Trichonephila clavipes]